MTTKTTVGSNDVIIRIIGAIIFIVRSYFYTVNLSDNARAQPRCHILLNSTSIDVDTCTTALVLLGIQCSTCARKRGRGGKLENIYGVDQRNRMLTLPSHVSIRDDDGPEFIQ